MAITAPASEIEVDYVIDIEGGGIVSVYRRNDPEFTAGIRFVFAGPRDALYAKFDMSFLQQITNEDGQPERLFDLIDDMRLAVAASLNPSGLNAEQLVLVASTEQTPKPATVFEIDPILFTDEDEFRAQNDGRFEVVAEGTREEIVAELLMRRATRTDDSSDHERQVIENAIQWIRTHTTFNTPRPIHLRRISLGWSAIEPTNNAEVSFNQLCNKRDEQIRRLMDEGLSRSEAWERVAPLQQRIDELFPLLPYTQRDNDQEADD